MPIYRKMLVAAVSLVSFLIPLQAQRDPVLKQIAEPHPYYFREMYLPQLTTGPSSVAWAPDSKSLVYSMAGTLWQQRVDSVEAEQITDGPGYDYQPDWSPDGHWIVFAKYAHDSVELWAVNADTRETHALTHESAVNISVAILSHGRSNCGTFQHRITGASTCL